MSYKKLKRLLEYLDPEHWLEAMEEVGVIGSCVPGLHVTCRCNGEKSSIISFYTQRTENHLHIIIDRPLERTADVGSPFKE